MENSNVDCLDLGVIQSNLLDMATFQVRHPVTGKVTGATILLYGPDSEMAQQLDVKLSDKRLQRIQQRGVQKISSQELSELTLEKLVGMTKEISNFFSIRSLFVATILLMVKIIPSLETRLKLVYA